MREIKFRGQTRRKGEYLVNMAGDKCDSNWVYGGIFPQNKDEKGFAIIYQQEPEIKKYSVYADTVGQYTGLKDKSGKEIYEGDIVNCKECECYGYISWNEDEAGFYFCVLYEDRTYQEENIYDYIDEMEVIGNIFDNKELLNQ